MIVQVHTMTSSMAGASSQLLAALLLGCLCLCGWTPQALAFSTRTATITRHTTTAFVVHRRSVTNNRNKIDWCCHRIWTTTALSAAADKNDDGKDERGVNPEGADLAAQFFKMAQEKGIGLDKEEFLLDDDDDDDEELMTGDADDNDEEEEDEEEEVNIPQGAINAFLGYDTGNVGEKLAGNVTLTNDKLYSDLKVRKERVLVASRDTYYGILFSIVLSQLECRFFVLLGARLGHRRGLCRTSGRRPGR
jgi:hypothetical protein